MARIISEVNERQERRGHFHYHQEKTMGERGKIKALAGICRFHLSYSWPEVENIVVS